MFYDFHQVPYFKAFITSCRPENGSKMNVATEPRRITEATFPRVKTLEDFHFDEAPIIPAAEIRKLAEGGYLSRSEPIIFLGETGTGKTHSAETRRA
jgi:DNA replication protein DnaC